jgi:acetyl-CoA synthetase
VDADHPALVIYTSGTTGAPKGTVLTHGGFGIKNAHDWAYLFDVGEGDRMFWVTDLGWLMGPMVITGTLLLGGTVVLFEGTPDYPKPDRLWQLCARHRVTHLGISPTAVRALMPYGADWIAPHDLSALRIIGSTGEPWNPEPYRWLFDNVGGGRVPIINYTGGTEISGGILGCFPICPLKPCAFNGPIPGMAADCYGEDGRSVRGEVGELVVTRPWPGMTAGFWKDPDRYLETYWSRWPDVWVHGDWTYVDADGYWFIHGRSDDTLKLAGKRVGPAEIESLLVGHPAVNEAAAVGVPHDVKGEAVVCFAVLRPGFEPSDALRRELQERVAQAMGKAIRPERVLFVRELPKTRSAKIMRRVIRATYLGKEPGDLSSLDNPRAIEAVSEAV